MRATRQCELSRSIDGSGSPRGLDGRPASLGAAASLLIVSDKTDPHVKYLLPHLAARGAKYRWIEPGDLPARATLSIDYTWSGLRGCSMVYDDELLELRQIRSVWYRRPTFPLVDPRVVETDSRRCAADVSQACLVGLADLLQARWLPGPPRAVEAAANKIHQLSLAPACGFRVPRTLVTNDPARFLQFYEELEGRVVTKLVRYVHGVKSDDGTLRVFFTYPLKRRDLANYRALRYAPMILQEYVPKRLELRVTVVGEKVFPAAIDSQASRSARHDWRHYDCDRTPYTQHKLPADIEAACVRLVTAYGLRFGALDLILTPSGEYVFLELNPNGQWAFVQELSGLPIADAVAEELVHQ